MCVWGGGRIKLRDRRQLHGKKSRCLLCFGRHRPSHFPTAPPRPARVIVQDPPVQSGRQEPPSVRPHHVMKLAVVAKQVSIKERRPSLAAAAHESALSATYGRQLARRGLCLRAAIQAGGPAGKNKPAAQRQRWREPARAGESAGAGGTGKRAGTSGRTPQARIWISGGGFCRRDNDRKLALALADWKEPLTTTPTHTCVCVIVIVYVMYLFVCSCLQACLLTHTHTHTP